MKIGIIGAGQIGGTLTRRFTALGHEVAVAKRVCRSGHATQANRANMAYLIRLPVPSLTCPFEEEKRAGGTRQISKSCLALPRGRWRRQEAAELAFEKLGKCNRCAILKVWADDLNADWQARWRVINGNGGCR